MREQINALDSVIADLGAVFSPVADDDRETRDRFGKAAQRVFHVSTLLEHILLLLALDVLLVVQQVNHQFKEATESSARLRRVLGQQSDQCGDFPIPLAACSDQPNFSLREVDFHDGCSPIEHLVPLHVTFSSRIPRLGKRWLDMFTCQTPIVEMTIYAWCCSDVSAGDYMEPSEGARSGVSTVSAIEGVKLRDLRDAARDVVEEHRLCPFAHPRIHRADGSIWNHVVFHGRVGLDPDGPIVARRQSERARRRPPRKKKAS